MSWTVQTPSSLIETLTHFAPDSSKNTVRGWIKQGRIEVNGHMVKDPLYPVKTGHVVSLGQKKNFIDDGVEILYEDKSLVVVYKPEGVLSVATDFDIKYNVHTFLKRRLPFRRVYPVHRLDRETSGVMMFAYTEQAKDHLKDQFEQHSIDRNYIAIVEGNVEPKQGVWQSYLAEDDAYVVKSVKGSEKGKLAVTHYTVLQSRKNTTLLSLVLETGRKNQIRVHCKEAGHPIVGDKKYGSTAFASRVYLHAAVLGFIHPVTGKKMVFERKPSPEFFRRFPKVKSPVLK